MRTTTTNETIATLSTIEDDTTTQHVIRWQRRTLTVSEIYLEFLIDAAFIATLAVFIR